MAYQYSSPIDRKYYRNCDKDFSFKNSKRKKLNRKLIKKRQSAKMKFFILFILIFGILLPNVFNFNNKHFFLKPFRNSNITVPQSLAYLNSAENVVGDNYFLDLKCFNSDADKSNLLKAPLLTGKMPNLERNLKNLMASYPNINAGIFIWDYDSGRYVDINAHEVYPTASIIKLPILLQLFKRAEKGLIDFNDSMSTENCFITSGSGSLQYFPIGTTLTNARLAELMIQNSDNTATNMLLYNVGGMNGINRVINQWGFTNTHINNWLPDLTGTNVSTPEEIARMLYNIDNADFLSLESRAKIVEILGHVKNRYLIEAGIPYDAQFLHKTGDIGNMLGDAGIVIMPNGRKYIIVIMAKRPWNSYSAKQFIIEASEITYKSISRNRL